MAQNEAIPTLVSTFYVGGGLFGIDTLAVREVIPLRSLTPVHHAPDYISGIINLRGQIVTVVNLAAKLNLEREAAPPPEHVIIVTWRGEQLGLLVDRVVDVEEADLDYLAPPPANLNVGLQRLLRGVCLIGARQISILDVDQVLDEENQDN